MSLAISMPLSGQKLTKNSHDGWYNLLRRSNFVLFKETARSLFVNRRYNRRRGVSIMVHVIASTVYIPGYWQLFSWYNFSLSNKIFIHLTFFREKFHIYMYLYILLYIWAMTTWLRNRWKAHIKYKYTKMFTYIFIFFLNFKIHRIQS